MDSHEIQLHLVIVNIIDVNGVAVLEAERYAPITGNRYSPVALQVALKRVQPQAGKVHVVGPTAAVQHCKYITKLLAVPRCHASCCSPIIEGFQSSVLERLYHSTTWSVSCRLSIDTGD